MPVTSYQAISYRSHFIPVTSYRSHFIPTTSYQSLHTKVTSYQLHHTSALHTNALHIRALEIGKVNKIENAFNKQLDVCTDNNNDCDRFFWRLEFDNTQTIFTGSAQQQLQFEIRYTGSSSHVQVATMQYNYNVGKSCGPCTAQLTGTTKTARQQ